MESAKTSALCVDLDGTLLDTSPLHTRGPDAERHVETVTNDLDASFDQRFISQIGSEREGFFSFCACDLATRLGIS